MTCLHRREETHGWSHAFWKAGGRKNLPEIRRRRKQTFKELLMATNRQISQVGITWSHTLRQNQNPHTSPSLRSSGIAGGSVPKPEGRAGELGACKAGSQWRTRNRAGALKRPMQGIQQFQLGFDE